MQPIDYGTLNAERHLLCVVPQTLQSQTGIGPTQISIVDKE